MPFFVSALLGGLVSMAPYVVGRVLIALGIGAVTYTGLSVTLNFLKTQVVSSLAGLPADVVGMLGFMKVGSAISIVFSAIVVRMTLEGLSAGGSISKLIKK